MGEPSGIFNAKGRESGGALRARAPNHAGSPIRWNREEVGNPTGFQTGAGRAASSQQVPAQDGYPV
jgi:hypothetical protein